MDELMAMMHKIRMPDETAACAARTIWNNLAKPLGSLGLLEESIVRIAALTGDANVRLQKRTLLVLCADNGVVAQGVTQTDSSVTAAIAMALAAGESTVCHMARIANCRVQPVDIGVLNLPQIQGVWDYHVCRGTKDITKQPAMTREQCVKAMMVGIEMVKRLAQENVQIIATGEMGIGNTTTSSAVASVLLHQPVSAMTGRGAGLSDAGLCRKKTAIETALTLHRPDAADIVDVLCKVGGADIAGLCGVFLGGAVYRVPILVDGFISAVAALCAIQLCPNAHCALLASHVSAEPAGEMLLHALHLKPLITAEMRLGEGSGAVAALPLLDMALAVYHSGQTFGHLGIDAYTPQT